VSELLPPFPIDDYDTMPFPVLNDRQLRAIVARHGLPVGDSIERMATGGVVHALWAMGDRYVLRVPKDEEMCLGDLRAEVVAIPIARASGVRTPDLLDFSHLSYVHENTIGTPSNATTRATVEPIDGGLKITRWYLNDQIQANRASIVTFTGAADRWQIYEWYAPTSLVLYTGAAPAGTGAREGHLVPEAMQYRHCSVQTPETATTTHYFFSHANNFKLDDPNVTDVVFGSVHRAFIEDKIIIEAQAAALAVGRPFEPVAIVHDAALIKGRTLIDRLIEAESSIAAKELSR
jgi:Vanillate O-demethylase oxygenase C-terminal domain